jgi:hypothetical protein
MRIPITLISSVRPKTVETTAVVDSGASGTFISEDFIKEHGIKTHRLKKPFRVWNADGTNSGKGRITHYCTIMVKVDQRTMYGKFNVHKLGHHDLILLGIPWLKAMNPTIDWANETLDLSKTERSEKLERLTDKERKKNGLKPLFEEKKREWKNSQLKKPSQEKSGTSMKETNEEKPSASAQPQHDPEQAIKSSLTPERLSSKGSFTASIEEIADEEAPGLLPIPEDDEEMITENDERFDTTNDVWIDRLDEHFAPAVSSIAEYALQDDEFLVEYSNSMDLRVFENESMDTPLTKDGTSFAEQKKPVSPLPRPAEYVKIGNKAQQFALAANAEQKKKSFEELVPEYLHDFADIFAKDGLNQLPPERPGIDHRIETKPGFIPKTSKIYPLSEKEREAVKTFINENVEKGFISESKSPQASGFFFVGKKSGDLRPCQDYRYINDWTVKNAYPLPLPLSLVARLHGAKYFTKMDVCSGYNNIRIHPDNRWKAAFTTEFGLYEPNVMFFGLCNSPATFQAYMNCTFQQEINEGWLIIYMDDILIFSNTLDEHRTRTRRILEKIRKEHLFLKPEKCTFDAQEVEYLGMIIRPGHVAMDTAKTEGIKDWPTPTSVKDVRSFLGFCNFYRNFVPHYSDIARPLIDLTKKDIKFLWSDPCQHAFNELKACFLKQPVL